MKSLIILLKEVQASNYYSNNINGLIIKDFEKYDKNDALFRNISYENIKNSPIFMGSYKYLIVTNKFNFKKIQ